MGTVLRMDEAAIGHRWEPITDLTEVDRAAASEELPPLARMWQSIRGEFDPMQVDDFNERLKREWAIETGIIERLYTLDRGTTQLLKRTIPREPARQSEGPSGAVEHSLVGGGEAGCLEAGGPGGLPDGHAVHLGDL